MPQPVFAVLDGGLFDNLPVMLAATGLTARSLFLGHGEQAAERYGPWLVNMPWPADVVTTPDLVQGLPAAVFWSCGDDATLYHYLRRLNDPAPLHRRPRNTLPMPRRPDSPAR